MQTIPPSRFSLVALCWLTAWAAAADPAGRAQPKPFLVAPKLPDLLEVLSPSDIQVGGWLGNRVALNESNRLVQVDLEPLLAGFRKKPGSHPWIGEHIGKWMHASTLAWANTGDPELRRRLDYAATELIKAQETDGYLGTYTPDKRFGLFREADWDVWSHKYNLIGLLTYYQYTGHEPALGACRKMGDLLIATFPARRSIIAAGTHVGMAATSVLEPMVLLYRLTGDERYLTFCRYVVKSWSEADGPRILESLNDHGKVNRTANGKAYEMLSNLVGLCELARATGERELLKPVLAAWQDVVSNRLYLIGACSQGEHFRDDHFLPNHMGAHVGEQCVTTTWIQLNWQLLRLTGEGRFADQLERVFYNQLAAAQRPDGRQWCYFTSPEGTKPYGPGINCCVSSGPRGMALVPQSAVLRQASMPGHPVTFLLNLWDSLTVTTRVEGRDVTLRWQTGFPYGGSARLRIETGAPLSCAVRVRVPAWASAPASPSFQGGRNTNIRKEQDSYVFEAADWTGAEVAVPFSLGPGLVKGDHGNTGRRAFTWGPLVLAYDQGLNPQGAAPLRMLVPQDTAASALRLESRPPEPLRFSLPLAGPRQSAAQQCVLVPYADAGASGSRYAVWLRAAGAAPPADESLFAFGEESRSAPGNVEGSITDNDSDSFVVTFNGQPQREAWFAVALGEPQELRRVVFAHGRVFHDGGWFSVADGGKPRVQIRRKADAAWESVGEIADYPPTTATEPGGLKHGQSFTLNLPQPVTAVALRVIGRPAWGDAPDQAFASCAELQAFAK